MAGPDLETAKSFYVQQNAVPTPVGDIYTHDGTGVRQVLEGWEKVDGTVRQFYGKTYASAQIASELFPNPFLQVPVEDEVKGSALAFEEASLRAVKIKHEQVAIEDETQGGSLEFEEIELKRVKINHDQTFIDDLTTGGALELGVIELKLVKINHDQATLEDEVLGSTLELEIISLAAI